MKKTLFAIAAALLFCLGAAAQPLDVQKKNVENFANVSAEDYFVLKFIYSDTSSVTVRADLRISDYVQTYVKGGTLYLELDEKKFPKELKKELKQKGAATPVLEADVYLPAINSVTLKDKANLSILDGFNSNKINIDLTDNAEITQMYLDCSNAEFNVSKSAKLSGVVNITSRLNIKVSNSGNVSLTQNGGNVFVEQAHSSYVDLRANVTTIEVESNGGSESHLSGTASLLKVTGSGSSRVDAELLESLDGEVLLTGSKCHVNITENLKVTLTNGAMLTYKRKPVFDIVRILNSTLITADDEKRK